MTGRWADGLTASRVLRKGALYVQRTEDKGLRADVGSAAPCLCCGRRRRNWERTRAAERLRLLTPQSVICKGQASRVHLFRRVSAQLSTCAMHAYIKSVARYRLPASIVLSYRRPPEITSQHPPGSPQHGRRGKFPKKVSKQVAQALQAETAPGEVPPCDLPNLQPARATSAICNTRRRQF